jgi:hypothetical protein
LERIIFQGGSTNCVAEPGSEAPNASRVIHSQWIELEQQFDLAVVIVDELSGGISADILEREVPSHRMSPHTVWFNFAGFFCELSVHPMLA